ncbi:MAG: chorismate mutase [Bacillota bacterium]
MLRGVRGATTAAANTTAAIADATAELILTMVRANSIDPADLAAATFAVTPDLDAAFPAATARALGWSTVPLLDYVSPAVDGALPRCIRVLLFWNTPLLQNQVKHIYLREAVGLRPDLEVVVG